MNEGRMICPECRHAMVVINSTPDITGTIVKVLYGCLSEDCKMYGVEQFSETIVAKKEE